MGCCGSISSIFNTRGKVIYSQKSLSHANCEDVTLGILKVYQRLTDCGIVNKVYTSIGITKETIESTNEILLNWINEKEIDPATCKFHDKLGSIKIVINKLVIYGRC